MFARSSVSSAYGALMLIASFALRSAYCEEAAKRDPEASLATSAKRVSNGDLIYCRVTLTNRASEPLVLPKPFSARRKAIFFEAQLPDGQWSQFFSADEREGGQPKGGEPAEIEGGKSVVAYATLWMSRALVEGESETVTLRACARISRTETVRSAPVSIVVDFSPLNDLPESAGHGMLGIRVVRTDKFAFGPRIESYLDRTSEKGLHRKIEWRIEFNTWAQHIDAERYAEAQALEAGWKKEMDEVTWELFQFGIARRFGELYFCDAAEHRLRLLPPASHLRLIADGYIFVAKRDGLCKETPPALRPAK